MHHEGHGTKRRAKEGQGVGRMEGYPVGRFMVVKGARGRGSSLGRWWCAICGMNQVKEQFRGTVGVEIRKVPPAGWVVAGKTGGEFAV